MWALLLWMLAAPAATQADVDAVAQCLANQDVACAQAIVSREGMATSSDPVLLALAAEVSFSAADYPGAYDRMAAAVEAGFDDDRDHLGLYERTMFATAGWVEAKRGRFRVRYRPGVDAILVDDAARALERTDTYVTPLLGEPPPGSTVVELYPDGRSFIAASSLTKDDVESTGVVAISKWTRLLVSSPRALGRGYEWQSTISHEYIHLVVAHNAGDKAPVWLQEAIAKYLDNRFEHGGDRFELDVNAQGYLAEALQNDALVPFDEMHPSLAKIKVFRDDGSIDKAASAERAALAYAQLSSLMQYAFELGGEGVLKRVLPAVRQGVDPREALRQAVNARSFTQFVEDWEAWIRAKTLVDKQLPEMPTVLDGGTADELDPVLSNRRDLANYLRLGDLLAERGRHRAALLEYERAKDDEDPNSPLLANRVAQALVALGDPVQARRLLDDSAKDYPTYPLTWRTLAMLAQSRGDEAGALDAYRRALALDPFHMASQTAVLDILRSSGSAEAVRAQEATVRILRRGGEDTTPPPLHERFGDYELPRSQERIKVPGQAPASALLDRPAPAFSVMELDGGEVTSASLKGKVVVLDFWATWCGPCRSIMPKLSELAAAHEDAGLVVLGITNETTSVVKRFLSTEAKRGNTFVQRMMLEDGSVRRAFDVTSIPKLVVIDQAGVVRLVHVGSGRFDEIERTVERLLGVATEEVTQ